MPQLKQRALPNYTTWDWQVQGACRGADTSIFFHPDGERGRARAIRERQAKAICQECPVMQECRAHALAIAEPYGIWGGLSESERSEILRTRRRSRNGRQHKKGSTNAPQKISA